MTIAKIALAASVVVALGGALEIGTPYRVSIFGDAHAVVGVAPGGSAVRRHAVVGTAVVASSTANASAAASANANAAAANANAAAAAAKPAAPAAPAGTPPVGTMVTTLPPGCAPTNLNGVDYQRCGATYYKASMMGSNLVFVVAQP